MNDPAAIYESDFIKILEWPKICTIVDKNHGTVDIRTAEDAKAVIVSLTDFLHFIPKEQGGFK